MAKQQPRGVRKLGADESDSNGINTGSSSSSSSGRGAYKGVRKRKWGKWVSEIRLPNSRERIWLGSYDSPEKAARAFDAALFCLRGRSASFNFPHNPPPDIPSSSLTPSQIQLAAANFANAYPHQHRENSASAAEDEDPSRTVASASTVSEVANSVATSSTVSDEGGTNGPGGVPYNNLSDFDIYSRFEDLNWNDFDAAMAHGDPFNPYLHQQDDVMADEETESIEPFLWDFSI
uniref:ERF017 n=1 Tax=Santalum album TaxID=35974 RepID=A0A1Z1EDH2_SANAL|nr:ERF017 [Santalum album]